MAKCIKCGSNLEDGNMYDYEGIGIEEVADYCFSCNFWANQVKVHRSEPDYRFIINNQSYYAGPEDVGAMRGYGGCKFTILTHTGKTIITTNMWCQGPVPECFGDELPDTAEFIPNTGHKFKQLPDDVPF